jgi:uncharacterized protein YodC (DUF2158 family)
MENFKMKGYYFKEGEEVVHKENPQRKMTIGRLIRKKIKLNIIDDSSTTVVTKDILRGIECHWWEQDITGEKILKRFKFHSKELVPYFIAQQGMKQMELWLNS